MEELGRTYEVRIPRTIIGAGEIKNTGRLAKDYGAEKVLIVTDAGIVAAGLLEPVISSLQESNLPFVIFDRGMPTAPLNIIEDCARVANEQGCNLLISVGGGSTTDTTKVAAVLAGDNGADVHDFLGMENVKKEGLPFIIIPTTAGSGSEWGGACVVTDHVDGMKKVIYSKYTWATVIIIDPMITLNLPRRITGDTGIDALSHAIESYTSWKANVVSDMFAEKAIELISQNLRIAYAKGRKHVEARYQMSLGAVMGIQACINASNGFGHSMNYPVAMRSHLSHGAAVAVMLPHVMDFNLLGCPHKYARIAELMGEDTIGLTEMEAAQKAVTAFQKLSSDIEMPQKLRDVGITRDDFPGFIDFLYQYQQYGMENNARDLTREDIMKIFEAAY